jgi:hypothetical protein
MHRLHTSTQNKRSHGKTPQKNADLPTPMNSSQFAAAVAAASLLTVEDSKALPSASLAEAGNQEGSCRNSSCKSSVENSQALPSASLADAGNSMTGIRVIHDERFSPSETNLRTTRSCTLPSIY